MPKVAKKAQDNKSKDTLSPENKKWLGERPTRMEVANYVNALWERHYLPLVTNYIQMSSMVLQAILIEKGICTGEEIKEITEKFVSEQQRRMAMDTAEGGLISRISRAVAKIQHGDWGASIKDENVALSQALSDAQRILTEVNFNESSTITDEDMKTCAANLESVQRSISSNIIKIQEDKVKVTLQILLGDIVDCLKKGVGTGADGDEEPKG